MQWPNTPRHKVWRKYCFKWQQSDNHLQLLYLSQKYKYKYTCCPWASCQRRRRERGGCKQAVVHGRQVGNLSSIIIIFCQTTRKRQTISCHHMWYTLQASLHTQSPSWNLSIVFIIFIVENLSIIFVIMWLCRQTFGSFLGNHQEMTCVEWVVSKNIWDKLSPVRQITQLVESLSSPLLSMPTTLK